MRQRDCYEETLDNWEKERFLTEYAWLTSNSSHKRKSMWIQFNFTSTEARGDTHVLLNAPRYICSLSFTHKCSPLHDYIQDITRRRHYSSFRIFFLYVIKYTACIVLYNLLAHFSTFVEQVGARVLSLNKRFILIYFMSPLFLITRHVAVRSSCSFLLVSSKT